MDQVPTLQALVLADHIYVDGRTGKKVIAGTFSCLWAREFPTTYHAPTWAYVSLTNVQGECTLTLRYVDVSTNSVLMERGEVTFTSEDQFANHELVMQVPPIQMPQEGRYAFEVYAGDTLLGRTYIVARRAEQGPEE